MKKIIFTIILSVILSWSEISYSALLFENLKNYKLAIDSSNNIYYTGKEHCGEAFNNAFIGRTLNWGNIINESASEPQDIVIDKLGDVCVAVGISEKTYLEYYLGLIKYSPDGELLLNLKYDIPTLDFPADLLIDEENYYYLTCVSGTVKLDSTGNTLMESKYGGSKMEVGTQTGNLYFTGVDENSDFYVLATDGNGEKLWKYSDGYFDKDYPVFSMAMDEEENLYVGKGYGDPGVFKLDNSGEFIWAANIYGNVNITDLKLFDNQYVYASALSDKNVIDLIYKLDFDGNIIWTYIDNDLLKKYKNCGSSD